jgi:hypothetical protein
MSDRRLTARLIATLLALALVAAACGDDSDGGDTSDATAVPAPTESTTTTAPAADSPEGAAGPASTLRASLTSLLQEHVYLAGLALEQALDDDGDLEAPATADAVATLDENSVDLSVAIGSIYGVAAGEQFLELWRTHIGFFVDYTLAQAAGDSAAAEEAREELEGYREDFGAFLASANDQLTKDGVAEELQPHVETLFAAIDGFVVDDPAAWSALREAAQVMPDTALTLASAIATQQRIEGDVESAPADLRADLTNLLQEHVYLAGAAIGQVVEDGGDVDAPGAAGAIAALDENSVALADVIGGLYGDDAGEQFLELWRTHIGFFVDYALARADGDAAAAAEAMSDLQGYREDFGAFLASANDLLTTEAVAAELQPHVDTLFVAIDAMVDGDPAQFSALRDAAQVMPLIALTLASNLQIDL